MSLAYVVSARMIRKAYATSKERDKNVKAQLRKPPTEMAFLMLICHFPILIYSTVKCFNPTFVLIDPGFFTYTMHSLNTEVRFDEERSDERRQRAA